MVSRYVPPKTVFDRPSDWLRRRTRVPRATAAAITDLAFETRARRLGDAGLTLAQACREVAR